MPRSIDRRLFKANGDFRFDFSKDRDEARNELKRPARPRLGKRVVLAMERLVSVCPEWDREDSDREFQVLFRYLRDLTLHYRAHHPEFTKEAEHGG